MSSLAQIAVIESPSVQVRTRTGAEAACGATALGALLVLTVVAPFEWPLFRVGALTVTSVEAVILTSIGLLAGAHLLTRQPPLLRTPISLAGAIFLVVLLVAALAAPAERGNALRFVARVAVAGMLFVLAVNAIDSLRAARRVVWTWLATATVIAAIAVLESAQVPAVMNALTVFRPGFHVVAGQLRATSTLFYPTITSMYLEVAFALALWPLLDPRSRYPRLERGVVFAALCVVGAGIIATFTRAGLFAMAASLVVVAVLTSIRRDAGLHGAMPPRTGLATLIALGVVLTGLVFVSHSPELLVTRMQTEGSHDWYGASYRVPASLQLETGRTYDVPVTLTNAGRLTWDSDREPSFAMSYHWLRAGSDAVVQFDGQRTAFETPVGPGAVVTMPVKVTAPGQPGSYTLVWDVVHETRTWLSTEGVPPARSHVEVRGAPVSAVKITMARLPQATIRPARPVLWSAALRMFAERPLLGVGPDNFRHRYGHYAGLERWDTRVHANNMYLELLSGAGGAGFVAAVWLVALSGFALFQRWRRAPSAIALPIAAAIAAFVAIAGHGLVDSFLSFTTTYLAFAVAAGLAFSPALTSNQLEAEPR